MTHNFLSSKCDITPELISEVLDGKKPANSEEEKIPSNIDFIKYALKVNEDKFKKGDSSYSSWYNKKKRGIPIGEILIFSAVCDVEISGIAQFVALKFLK